MDSRQHAPLPVNPVGDLLRGWRNRRAMSQADLAFEAGISIKHLSYVETGKAAAPVVWPLGKLEVAGQDATSRQGRARSTAAFSIDEI